VCLLSAAANTYQAAGESGSLRVRLLVTLDPLNLPVRLAPRLLKLMLSSLLRRIVLRKPKRVGWLDQLNDEAVGAVEAAAGEVGTFGHLGGLLDRYAPPLRASRTGISGCRTAQPVSDRSDG
jgi:hypothetical protein